jgi:hypothetical protein
LVRTALEIWAGMYFLSALPRQVAMALTRLPC